jgi:hypothetical protein
MGFPATGESPMWLEISIALIAIYLLMFSAILILELVGII